MDSSNRRLAPARLSSSPLERWLNLRVLWIVSIAVLGISLIVAPLTTYRDDMQNFWVPWQVATGGLRPFAPYALTGCNYPPVVLYLLTIADALRQSLGIDPASRLNWTLVKLPNLAFQVIGAFACVRALKPHFGERAATPVGLAWVASLSFLVNATLWGQWDVLFSFTLLMALLASLRGRHFASGVWLGVALATKVQAIFAFPIYGVFLLTLGWRATLRATAGGVLALIVLFTPIAMGGRLRESVGVYTASVDTFPARSLNAWNIWTIANGVEVRLLHKPKEAVTSDRRAVVPRLSERFTYKHLGEALFGTYVVAMLVVVAHRRNVRTLSEGVPICGLAMFMLATQMHERYSAPAAALMTLWLLLETPWRWQFVFWTCSAALNQLMGCYSGSIPQSAFQAIGGLGSAANVVAFVHVSWLFFHTHRVLPAPEAEPTAALA